MPYFYYIADETPIVPEHIWSTSRTRSPISTSTRSAPGPSPCRAAAPPTSSTRRTRLLAARAPQDRDGNFPSYLSNNAANADLTSGIDQWGSQYIPNIQAYYLNANPKYYHYWFEPVYNVMVWINLTNPLLTLAVRQAMAYAINRAQVSTIGESGYQPASNQTDIVKPTFSSWYDSARQPSTETPTPTTRPRRSRS